MKSVLICFFIVLVAGFSSFSYGHERFAESDNSYDEPNLGSSVQLLTPDVAQALYGSGRIPHISDVDRYYNSGHTSLACRRNWSAMRRRRVNPVGIRAPLKKLEASAKRAGLSLTKLHHTLGVFLENQTQIPDQRYISVVDFDKTGAQNRWFFIDLRTGSITAYRVSAGMGSDPNHSGRATLFSNERPSRGRSTNASSLGCAIAAGHYHGKHGDSIMVHGMESTNNNSCARAIAVHDVTKYAAGLGRSDGCLAIAPRQKKTIFSKLGAGGLVCSLREGHTGRAPLRGHRRSYVRKWRRHARLRKRYVRRRYARYYYNNYY